VFVRKVFVIALKPMSDLTLCDHLKSDICLLKLLWALLHSNLVRLHLIILYYNQFIFNFKGVLGNLIII
jgi:hypothetical protein